MKHDMAHLAQTGPTPIRPDVAEWQAAHEPLLTVRAWRGNGGETMTAVRWAEEVERMDVMEKPLVDMLAALLHVARILSKVSDAVVQTAQARETLMAVEGDN